MVNENPRYVYLKGVKLHPDWGVIRGYGSKWHLGDYDCTDSLCGRGPTYGFDECEPLESIDTNDLCDSCLTFARTHNVEMSES